MAGLMVVLSLGLGACGGGGDEELTADVKIEDDTLRFDPDELEFDLNQETSFTFLNNDDVIHNVTIPGIAADAQQNAIDMDAPVGQRISVRIPAVANAPRDGFFLFYCKFHQTEGMSGRLRISS